jgi:hypothetical protein
MAKTMTIKQARKIIGVLSDNISDDEIERDIEAATLLKDLFFEKLKKTHKKGVVALPNVP